MNIIRPIMREDLDALEEIAQLSGPGFTSLPFNRELLKTKIERSLASFQSAPRIPGEQSYFFVLEELESGSVIGTCAIEASVGTGEPWYHYRIGTIVHASRELGIHNEFETLYLCNDYTGCSEICTLFLLPEHRHKHSGSLLSKSRFLFMAEFPERFSKRVIAEMRGLSDTKGRSPFWDGLGQHFFSMEFSQADYLTGIGNKSFIAELMPKHSIYIHLLPKPAQQALGQVHEHTRAARAILEQEGFRYEGYVDIFDGGPTLCCRLKDIHSIRSSSYAKVSISESQQPTGLYVVCNTELKDFRCALLELHREPQGLVTLNPQQAEALKVNGGGSLRLIAVS